MTKIKGTINTLLLTFLITSCGTFNRSISNQGKVDITRNNIDQFNGHYRRLSNSYGANQPVGYYDFNDLFQCFYLWKRKKLWPVDSSEKDFVALEVIDEKRIKVGFVVSGKVKKSKILKGELTENTFVFNARNFLVPLLLMNYGERHRTRISLSENGSLNVDAFQFAIGNFFIFPWTGGYIVNYNLEFSKINKPRN